VPLIETFPRERGAEATLRASAVCLPRTVGDITQPEIWYRILTEARRQLYNLLDIDAPAISVVPGPAHAHGEYAFAGAIVLAADTAAFKDEQHLNIGVMPADGVQVFNVYKAPEDAR